MRPGCKAMLPGLTVLNLYALNAPAEAFTSAITALAARVQGQGHSGVLSYRFFVNPVAGVARAVVDYADTAAWIGHHDIAMGWPEMQALHGVAKLADVTFLGPFAAEVRDWLGRSTLTAQLHTGFDYAAGFQRLG